MSFSLPADLQQRIEAQVAGGAFASEEDVLRGAIEALEQRQRGLAQLRGLVEEADDDVAAGRVGPFDRDALKREVRARLAQQGIVD